MARLIKRVSLTISRDNGAGYYDSSGKWIASSRTDIPILCNIQPYRKSDVQNILPEGIKSDDVLIIYTETPIQTANQFAGVRADTTTIDNLIYEAMSVENWARDSMRLNHYKTLFVRQDKLKNGGL